MPSISYSSVLRTATDNDMTLALNARHRLVVGSPSETVYSLKSRVPEQLDVFLAASCLVFSFSGQVDRVKVANNTVYQSAILSHFAGYLKSNAAVLGFTTVSDVYIDEEDGLPKLSVASSNPLPVELPSPCITLVAIDMMYLVKARQSSPTTHIGEETDPFCPQLLLPLEAALTHIIEKFVTFHLVRYCE
ncbi:hypothetical protein JAAARDRAFT_451521 [Jaapia argillacea MUCL 33604]|uniref:Uncharacterized protein n=1 Tax=Jaapia argillacea MUCL 33604 TaxID=933084 RepID=A0A067Q5D5_9AGAM|nr:hypothetical protein JAAARDRAFT_451521 [Jaapia argillacea MUCL 33604]